MTLPGRILGRHGRATGLLLNVEPNGTRNPIVSGQTPTFTRATVGGLVADTLGYVRPTVHSQLKYEAVDLDGDGIRETMGLLIEQQRTNAFTYSEQFDNAAWGKNNCTIAANATTAPDGTLTADALLDDAVNTSHYIARSAGTLTDSTYSTFSVWARDKGTQWFFIAPRRKDNTQPFNYFDLLNGVVGNVGSGCRTRIEKYAGGWYRCIVSFDAMTGGTSPNVSFGPATGNGTAAYTGNGVTGVYLWGAQFETDKTFHTSYIPTVASTVQRNNDALTFTPAWPMQDITIYAKVARAWWMDLTSDLGGTNHHCFVCHIQPTATTNFRLYWSSAAASPRWLNAAVDSGTAAATQSTSTPSGAVIEMCAQFVNLATAPDVRIDVGAGFGAYAGALTEPMPDGWSAGGSYIGGDSTSERRLHAPLLSLKVAAGARTMAEMRGLV